MVTALAFAALAIEALNRETGSPQRSGHKSRRPNPPRAGGFSSFRRTLNTQRAAGWSARQAE
jgi:hypothetical protein